MDTALLQPIEALHTPLVYSSCHITQAGALARTIGGTTGASYKGG